MSRVAQAHALQAIGMSYKEIALLLSYTDEWAVGRALWKYRKRQRTPRPHRLWTPEEDATLAAEYRHWLAADLASRLGRTRFAVVARAHVLGIRAGRRRAA